MLGVEHRACPISLRLLTGSHTLGHTLVFLYEEIAVGISRRQVLQHLGKSGKHPSVASCPEVLLAAGTLVLGIYIFAVAEIKSGLGIEHNRVAILDVLIEFFEIEVIARSLIQLGHHRHHHIESVGPPPIVVRPSAHLILHHLACTAYAVVVGQDIIKVEICLETNLPIAEEHMLLCLAVVVFPLAAVVACCALPLVVLRPSHRVVEVFLIARKAISLHVAGVIGSHMPKRRSFGFVAALPTVVHFVDDTAHFCRLTFGRGIGNTC